jgi:histidyl-tRNA synthetase
VEHGFRGNMKKRLKRADAARARYAFILGDDELVEGKVTLRDLDAGAQELVFLNNAVEALRNKWTGA